MKLAESRTGTLTDGYKMSLESVAVTSEPISPTVTRLRQVGMPVDPEEPVAFINIRRLDGLPIKPGLYDYTTMGETYRIENHGAIGCFVSGRIGGAGEPQRNGT